MSKRITSILIAFTMTLALVLSGCGSASNAPSSSPDSSAASSTAASTGEQTASAADNTPYTITTTIIPSELSNQEIADFEKLYPNLKVRIVNADQTKLMAMLAAGNPVDVIRTSGYSNLAMFITRGLAMPLDSYIDKSTVIKKDDIQAANDTYQFDGTNIGTGSTYGFAKDWSMAYSLFINKKLFKDAGIDVPSADAPLTFSQLGDLSKRLTKKENGKITVFGFVPYFTTQAIEGYLASLGKSLWSDDMKTSKFSSPEAKSILQYFVDLEKAGYAPSSLNPVGDGWGGTDFMDDKIGIVQQGYWYGGMIRSNDKLKGRESDFAMLPTPVPDGGAPMPSTQGATGAFVYSKTKNPDAVWKFMEYYFFGEPADNRAKSGWGLPLTQSKMSMVPASTDFDKSLMDVLQKELSVMDMSKIKINKYAPETSTDPIITKYLDPVLYDKDTLDGATEKMDADVASVIADGIDITGGQ